MPLKVLVGATLEHDWLYAEYFHFVNTGHNRLYIPNVTSVWMCCTSFPQGRFMPAQWRLDFILVFEQTRKFIGHIKSTEDFFSQRPGTAGLCFRNGIPERHLTDIQFTTGLFMTIMIFGSVCRPSKSTAVIVNSQYNCSSKFSILKLVCCKWFV